MHAQKKLKKILARKEDNLIENKKQNKTKERQGQGPGVPCGTGDMMGDYAKPPSLALEPP